MSTKEISIGTKDKKLTFTVPQPYTEGQTISAIEAKVLNQTLAENIGNNFRARVQAHLEGAEGALTEEQLREAFDKYAEEYEFSEASAGGSTRTMTPFERECRKVATAVVLQLLKKPVEGFPNGRKRSDVSKEAFDGEVARFADSDKVKELAQKNLDEQEALFASIGNE